MASETDRLKLLKKDPVADGNETFNIKTMLNDNWDKIDQEIALDTDLEKLKNKIGETTGLDTETKTNLTAAVNELERKRAEHQAESAKKHIHSSGSNSDGKWIRFDDGTQVVNHMKNFADHDGDIFFYDWTYPINFTSDDVSITYGLKNNTESSKVALSRKVTRYNNGFVINSGGEPQTIVLNIIAVGRWK